MRAVFLSLLFLVSSVLAAPIDCATLVDARWISTQLSKEDRNIEDATNLLVQVCAHNIESSTENECRMHAECARGKTDVFICSSSDKSGRSYREWSVLAHLSFARQLVSARCLAFARSEVDRDECLRTSQAPCRNFARQDVNQAPFEDKPPHDEDSQMDRHASLYSCKTSLGMYGISSGFFQNKKNIEFYQNVVIRRCLLRSNDPTQAWEKCAAKLECHTH